MFAARLLSLADDGDRSAQAAIVRAFAVFFLAHIVVRTLQWTVRADDWLVGRWLMTAALAACAVVAWRDPLRTRAAAVAALLVLTIKFVASFPTASNHFFIEFLCLSLLALCDARDGDERALLLSAARWLTVIVLFYSGLQKVLHATYFDGQFLGVAIGQRSSLAWVFGWLLPGDEIDRLRALHPLEPGKGPFDLRSPLALLVANGVYVFEMAAPVFLIWRRTRPYAAMATLAVIAGIEFGARELLFGILYVNLLLLFFAKPVNRAVLPLSLAVLAILAAARIGLLPTFWFN